MTLWRSSLPQSEPTQNIGNYYINRLIFELSSWWQESEAVWFQTKTRQGPTDWNCALRCQLIYHQSAAGISCRQENLDPCKLVAERGEAVGTRRSRRSPDRDQQIEIVLRAANSYIASPPLRQIVVKRT